MIFNKKRVLIFVLAALIAIQPLAAVQANQPANASYLISLYNSFKSAWNKSSDWKNYAAVLATLAGLYGVYRWATDKSVKPQEQPEKPGEQNKKPAGPNANQPPAMKPVGEQPEPKVDDQNIGQQPGLQPRPMPQMQRPVEPSQFPAIPSVVSTQSPVIEQVQPQLQQKEGNKSPAQQTKELIQNYVRGWVKRNRNEMNGVFLENNKYSDNDREQQDYIYLPKDKMNKPESERLFSGLVQELKTFWDQKQGSIGYELTSGEVSLWIKDMLYHLGFRGSNDETCKLAVLGLIEPIVDQKWDPELPIEEKQSPVQQTEVPVIGIPHLIEEEKFEITDLTETEKEYLSQISPDESKPLDLKTNEKRAYPYDDIFNVGDSSAKIIRQIYQHLTFGTFDEEFQFLDSVPDKKAFLEKLFKKATNIYVQVLGKSPYNQLKEKIEEPDKEALKKINWNYEELSSYYSNHFGGLDDNAIKNRSQFPKAAFWIAKSFSIKHNGFGAWNAKSGCNILKKMQEANEMLKKDHGLRQAIEISCEKAHMEKENRLKILPK